MGVVDRVEIRRADAVDCRGSGVLAPAQPGPLHQEGPVGLEEIGESSLLGRGLLGWTGTGIGGSQVRMSLGSVVLG
jgi:hypothetical protein